MLRRIIRMIAKPKPLDGIISRAAQRSLQKKKRFVPGTAMLLGRAVRYSDATGFLHSVKELFGEETYRFKAQGLEPLIIDLGANIGLSIIYFKTLYPQAEIIAYEPDPQIFELLQANTAAFAYNKVQLRNAAAWVANTSLEFYTEGSLAGSTEVDFLGHNAKCTVRAERLKEVLAGRQIEFLKIDIEGAENELLFDIAPELQQVRYLFVEYHSIAGREQKLAELLAAIKAAGFRCYIKNAAGLLAHPYIETVNTGFDLQLNIFCCRNV